MFGKGNLADVNRAGIQEAEQVGRDAGDRLGDSGSRRRLRLTESKSDPPIEQSLEGR